MTNIIRFLESMGSAPALSGEQFNRTVAALDIGQEGKRALLDRDSAALNKLLEGRDELRCAVFAEDED
jgi:hypothetical protein